MSKLETAMAEKDIGSASILRTANCTAPENTSTDDSTAKIGEMPSDADAAPYSMPKNPELKANGVAR